jgi:hypothetical protein
MDDVEVKRLRKEICRSFNSSPHKKKYWLALLEKYARKDDRQRPGAQRSMNDSEVNSSRGGKKA